MAITRGNIRVTIANLLYYLELLISFYSLAKSCINPCTPHWKHDMKLTYIYIQVYEHTRRYVYM